MDSSRENKDGERAELIRALAEKQAFIDSSPDIFLKIGADLTIVQADGACQAVSGWSAAELLGKNTLSVIPPQRRASAQQSFRSVLSRGHPSTFTAEYAHKGGHLVTIEWSATPTPARDFMLLVGRDVTARELVRRQAERANAEVASILNRITEGCISLDREWRCTYVNAKAGEWVRRAPQELIGKNLWDEFPEAVGGVFYDTYHCVMQTQQFGQCEAFYAPLGRWLEARAYPSEDGLTIFFLDNSERKQHELTLVHSATHDALTGLPNRTACLEALAQRLRSDLSGGDGIAVIFIDLDRFKEINDAFGHAAGDLVLREIGQRLRGFACQSCYPARISGDEFVVISSAGTEAQVRSFATQLLASVAAPIALNGHDITMGASIGISLAHCATTGADELINQADTAMYASKANGRHVLTIFNGDVNNWNLRRHRLRQDMLHAIHHGELRLYYQPQISLIADRVMGAEALIRWQHPEFGLLSPAAFLEIAEESPLIIDMGAWVFDEACRQLRQWQDLGHAMFMSINVSARQLANRDMPEMMAQAIRRHGVSPHCIKLEVTESMLAQDFDAMSQVLNGLKQKGFRIALDDFGTGYSNLSYISRLPVTAIKIDRSFVVGLAADRAALPLIKGIVALAKSLELMVICEGVETEEQRALLQSTECDYIQGYLISKPIPAGQFYADFLQHQSGSQ